MIFLNCGISMIFLILLINFSNPASGVHVDIKPIEYKAEFEKYKATNRITYSSESEENSAFATFVENYQLIKDHNQDFIAGNASFELAINTFADKDEEFMVLPVYDLFEEDGGFSQRTIHPFVPKTNLTYLNYTELGCVSPVRNQGRCGACYAFAVAGSVEGVCCKKHKRFVKISEQQMVSCSRGEDYGNLGCAGGKISSTFSYLIDFGSMSNVSFPYTARDDRCTYDATKVVQRIRNFIRLDADITEEYLKDVLAEVGPLVVAINASSKLFQFYKSGCFFDEKCSTSVNHAMVLVGFGTDPNCGDYWILKNFYGSRWGESGYMRMARGTGNLCGFMTQVFYPIC